MVFFQLGLFYFLSKQCWNHVFQTAGYIQSVILELFVRILEEAVGPQRSGYWMQPFPEHWVNIDLQYFKVGNSAFRFTGVMLFYLHHIVQQNGHTMTINCGLDSPITSGHALHPCDTTALQQYSNIVIVAIRSNIFQERKDEGKYNMYWCNCRKNILLVFQTKLNQTAADGTSF